MPRKLNYLKSDQISAARAYMAAGSIGQYALFAGGINGSGNSDVVDAFNELLVKSTPMVLSEARAYLACTNAGNHILFGGGSNVVDAYDTSLTRIILDPLYRAASYLGAASVGQYGMFAGGLYGTQGGSTINVYDASLTKIENKLLGSNEKAMIGVSTKKAPESAHLNGFAIFASNYHDSTGRVVAICETGLTMHTLESLSSPRVYMGACNLNGTTSDIAMFAGGATDLRGSNTLSTIDTYDGVSGTHQSTSISLKSARYQLAGANNNKYSVFAGGYTGEANVDIVDVFDNQMTAQTITPTLSDGRCRLAGTNLGEFDFIFAGGYNNSAYRDTVDILEDSWKNVKTSKVMYGDQVVIDLTGDTVGIDKMLAGYTAHNADGEVITGVLESTPAATYTPGTTDQTLTSGQILSGSHILKGDANLLAENIKEGVTIFGVTGEYTY